MFNLRTRKIFRDIWDHKARAALVVLTIALSVFSVGSLGRAWYLLSHNLNTAYLGANPSSANISTARPFGEEIVKRVERLPGVKDAAGRSVVWARLLVGPNQWETLQLISRSDFENLSIDIVTPEEGAWPPAKNTILMERMSLDMLPYDIGDTVIVEFNNGEQKELLISGTVHDVTQIPTAFSLVHYGYITPETLELTAGITDFSTLDITVDENQLNQEYIEDMVAQASSVMESNGQVIVSKVIPPPGKHDLDNIIQSVLVLLSALSALGLVLSVFLVINIISALLTQQTQQIGTIKAVGGVSSQVLSMYLGLVMLFGLISLLITVPINIIFSSTVTSFFAAFINFEITNFNVPVGNFLLEIFAGMIVPNLAALYPILNASRLTVRESIGFSGARQSEAFGTSGFEQLLGSIPNIPATILYPFRNIFRRKVRLALATITLSIAGAILIAVFSVRSSFSLTVDQIAAYWQEDITIAFLKPYPFSQVERVVAGISGVESIEPRLAKNAFRERPDGSETTRTLTIFGLLPDSDFIEPQLVEGRWITVEDEENIVINLDMQKIEPDLGVGDDVVFKIEGQEVTLHIVGIATSQVIGGEDLLNSPIAYVNYNYLAKVMREPGRVNRILIRTTQHNAEYTSSVLVNLEDILNERGFSVATTLLRTDVREALDGAFEIILSLLQLSTVVFGLVGGLGLMSMMTLNVLERIREIGIIRSVGGVRSQLGQIVIIEGVFVGILSWFLSVLLAYPLSYFLGNALGRTLLNVPLTHIFNLTDPLIWLGLVIILSILSSLIPSQNAARLSIRETLAYE